MFKSMTGYGRSQQVIDGYEILTEIKSVNHRFFEYTARVPRAYGYLEEKIKSFLQRDVSRGKVEVNVSIYSVGGTDAQIQINRELAAGYVGALRSVKEDLQLVDDLSLGMLSRLPDIFTVQKQEEDQEVIWNAVKQVMTCALASFVEMREVEGRRMERDVLSRIDTIKKDVEQIELYAPRILERYRERLYAKLQEVLENKAVDEQRVLTEVALLADKLAVDEETVRLKSHFKQFAALVGKEEAVGRKLDFLVQEINREINTLGSKIQDITVTNYVVEMKAELEKIREQIQNVE